jgi:hypothetical protein
LVGQEPLLPVDPEELAERPVPELLRPLDPDPFEEPEEESEPELPDPEEAEDVAAPLATVEVVEVLAVVDELGPEVEDFAVELRVAAPLLDAVAAAELEGVPEDRLEPAVDALDRLADEDPLDRAADVAVAAVELAAFEEAFPELCEAPELAEEAVELEELQPATVRSVATARIEERIHPFYLRMRGVCGTLTKSLRCLGLRGSRRRGGGP